MNKKITPAELEEHLIGKTVVAIRRRRTHLGTHVDLRLLDGEVYQIHSAPGGYFLGVLINILEKTKPITHIERFWLEDRTFVLRVYAGKYELFKVHATVPGEAWPLFFVKKED